MAVDYSRGVYIKGVQHDSTAAQVAADTDKFGTYHMAAAPAIYEPQRVNNFEFQVVGLNRKLSETGNNPYNVPTYGDLSAEEVIRVAVDKSFVPHFTQTAIPIKRGNSTLKYAGAPTFSEGTISIKDFIGARTKDALMAWQNLSYNVFTEKVGLASDYKLNCYLREYTPDYQLVRTWKLYGCWISSITESEKSSDSQDGVNSVNITIQYDRAIPESDDELLESAYLQYNGWDRTIWYT